MIGKRVIPCLLLSGNRLVKTRQFKNPVYLGDPVNATRIFSEKEVDEIAILDIDASRLGLEPNYELIAEIAGECFMPTTYGGGIRTLEQVRRLIRSGVEKVVINSSAYESTNLIADAVKVFGSQAIVGGIDVLRANDGKLKLMARSATTNTGVELLAHVDRLTSAGVGEIFVNSIDRDGEMTGFDLDLIRLVANNVSVPVVACGGAGTVAHLRQAVSDGGASAVAAGGMFVFFGKYRAVLINYPAGLQL